MSLALTRDNIDPYDCHDPMTWFGFGALSEGRLPLWNPWQFAGGPFLAAYYSGLFYPRNIAAGASTVRSSTGRRACAAGRS